MREWASASSGLNPAEPRRIWKNSKHGAKWIVQPDKERLVA
jgi:hypothetical protein